MGSLFLPSTAAASSSSKHLQPIINRFPEHYRHVFSNNDVTEVAKLCLGCGLSVVCCRLSVVIYILTHNPELITHNSQPTTHNSQHTTCTFILNTPPKRLSLQQTA